MRDEHAEKCQCCDWQSVDEVRPVAEPWQPITADELSKLPELKREFS